MGRKFDLKEANAPHRLKKLMTLPSEVGPTIRTGGTKAFLDTTSKLESLN